MSFLGSVGHHRSPLQNCLRYRAFCSGVWAPTIKDSVSVEWSGLWWDARIEGVKNDKFLVALDKWPSQWDEWISVDSGRLQPRCSADLFEKYGKDSSSESSQSSGSYDRDSGTHEESRTSSGSSDTTNNSPSTHSHRTHRSPRREVAEVDIMGRKYMTSNLRDGRLVFRDIETGLLSWTAQPLLSRKTSILSMSPTTSVTPPVASTAASEFLERKDLNGVAYYFNPINSKSQYEKPSLSPSEVARSMATAAPVSPPWEVYFDGSGLPYYHNTDTLQTIRALPSEPTVPQQAIAGTSPALKVTSAKKAMPSKTVAPTKKVTPAKMEKKTGSPKKGKDAKKVKVDSPPKISDAELLSETTPAKMDKVLAGWEVFHTDDGIPYYHNAGSGETVWELPTASTKKANTGEGNWWDTDEKVQS